MRPDMLWGIFTPHCGILPKLYKPWAIVSEQRKAVMDYSSTDQLSQCDEENVAAKPAVGLILFY